MDLKCSGQATEALIGQSEEEKKSMGQMQNIPNLKGFQKLTLKI